VIEHPLGLTVVILAAAAAASIVIDTIRLGIGPTPTSRAARRTMLALLPAEIEGPILELGAGFGGLAVALARARPDDRIRAFEASTVPWLVAWLRARLGRRRNLRVLRSDFRREPLGDAGAVVCYLFPGAMTALAARLPAELRPGTPVASYAFRVPGWTAEREEAVPGIWRSTAFLYRSPPATSPRDCPCGPASP